MGNSTVTDNDIKHHRAINPGTAGISNNPTTVNGNNNNLTPSAEGDVDKKTDIGTSPDPPAPVPANNSKLLSATDLASQVIPPNNFATTYMTVVDFHIRPKNNVIEFNLEEIFGGMVVAFAAVDPTMYFKSWNSTSASKFWSVATIPTTEADMKESYCSNRSIWTVLW